MKKGLIIGLAAALVLGLATMAMAASGFTDLTTVFGSVHVQTQEWGHQYPTDTVLNAQQDVWINGANINGRYTWSTEPGLKKDGTSYGRSTGLACQVTSFPSPGVLTMDDGDIFFTNWADFSEMTGSGIGKDETYVYGANVNFEMYYGRHQGYKINNHGDMSADYSAIYGGYWIEHYTEATTDNCSHFVRLSSVNPGSSGHINNMGWSQAGSTSGRVEWYSDGGWGVPTPYPDIHATGGGDFYEDVIGDNYVYLGNYYSGMTAGGGMLWRGGLFPGTFDLDNPKAIGD